MGLGRLVFCAAAWLAAGASMGAAITSSAYAGDCPGHPDALGVSRTIVVDPREHTRIGTMSYEETLPLRDHEVVLTFDDGPIAPYTSQVLDILAAQCIKATYFMVGTMARERPALVRRVYEDGHTIGTHSMGHPNPFKRLGIERTREQIDDGITATAAALGDPTHLAPFFRFPGFGRTDEAEEYLASRGLMAWGADFPADDWKSIGPAEVVKRAMRRIEAKGKGILLLHDIHQRTVEALPTILKQLKDGGYRIVHVVPATPERPATVTTAGAWLMHPHSKFKLPVLALAEGPEVSAAALLPRSEAELCALQLKPQPPREASDETGALQKHKGGSNKVGVRERAKHKLAKTRSGKHEARKHETRKHVHRKHDTRRREARAG
jgi:peptidoglycan/xylan/chitin deacetylase (PgdA/CDA1 family)